MRIAIYTVATAPAAADVADWCNATQDADYRIVLDLGAGEASADLLRAAGIAVQPGHVTPWRYDDALNTALALVPAPIDVCLRLDLNERLSANWRELIERSWRPNGTMLLYTYIWGTIPYSGDRIHTRSGYRWRGRAHERLIWQGEDEPFAYTCPELTIHYLPRATLPQPFALPLLQADAQEWPTDAEIALCYARELIYQQRYEAGRRELQRYLAMAGERGARAAYAFRLLAHADRENAMAYFAKAEDAYSCASNFLIMAEHYYQTKQWRLCYTNAQFGIALQRGSTAVVPPDWGDDLRLNTSLLHELASYSAYYLWDFEAAYGHAVEAVRRAPQAQPLRQHLNRVQAKIQAGGTLPVRRLPSLPSASAPAPASLPPGTTLKIAMQPAAEAEDAA